MRDKVSHGCGSIPIPPPGHLGRKEAAMADLERRDILKLGGMLAASGLSAAQATSQRLPDTTLKAPQPVQSIVNFIYDGLHLTPQEYAHILQQYTASGKLHSDNYSNGGIIEELEQKSPTSFIVRFIRYLRDSSIFKI